MCLTSECLKKVGKLWKVLCERWFVALKEDRCPKVALLTITVPPDGDRGGGVRELLVSAAGSSCQNMQIIGFIKRIVYSIIGSRADN